jgi:hypothetical protein
MKKSTNSWGLTYNSDWAGKNSNKRANNRESFSVKLCPVCNTAYEITRNVYQNTVTTHYHEDFPRTGLYQQTCLKCR